ncbi:hypothetical protein B0H15DRAFT_807430 [Mycena belliarum]|uniref:Uncharacterized protein n=1 Tax=Mycena belliarum TaxID=1033014 RepID=A0AAD6TNS3_9AGAR|nr:hypothetical protein B0H15DRAFT_807430 [Mycena belliae]
MNDLAEYTTPVTGREFFTGPIPDPQDWDSKFNTWNAKHHAIKRVSDEVFALVGQGQETGTYVSVSAKQVALFVAHNEDLWYNLDKKVHGTAPLGYSSFAMHLISFDSSADVWAYFDDQTKSYVYPTSGDGARLDIPSWSTWSVHPQQIGEYRIPGGMALVSQENKDAMDRQIERNWVRQQQAQRRREFKRQAHADGSISKPKPRREVQAAILARTREARGGDPAAGGERRTTRQHLPNHAAAHQEQVPTTGHNTTTPASTSALTPAPTTITAPVQFASNHIPPITTIDLLKVLLGVPFTPFGWIAQWLTFGLEHLTWHEKVLGSIPSPTIFCAATGYGPRCFRNIP